MSRSNHRSENFPNILQYFIEKLYLMFTLTSEILKNAYICIIECLNGVFSFYFGYFIKKKGAKWFTVIGIVIVIIAAIIYFVLN